MSVSPFSVQHDAEVQEYKQRRATYLAAEKKRKQEAKVSREASIASMKKSRSMATGKDKDGRKGFLKKLLNPRHQIETGDKDGMSASAVHDDGDATTLVDESEYDADQVSLKTALGETHEQHADVVGR